MKDKVKINEFSPTAKKLSKNRNAHMHIRVISDPKKKKQQTLELHSSWRRVKIMSFTFTEYIFHFSVLRKSLTTPDTKFI